ncbi:hypothetical protein DFH07DRAFT_1056886 [Mycena maculata]|uniref:Uncharacterized protein n=1 Tax=Mycena maculata TaxID=230809 RepID=A0AAD7NSW1_9AGAR|nr:hypothetical protein DFH07DRAFT_1056886 [Mycena maculata]
MSSHSSSERPTLPSLHTLNLLPPSYAQRPGGSSPYDSYERPSCPRPNVAQHSWPYKRRVSTSSSTSRTPSPTPSDASSSASSSPTSPSKSKLTLIPSSFADADAVVVVPPPNGAGQSLLLMGPALEHLRHPQRQISKGTRLHPYRFAPSADSSRRISSRRTSVSSSVSSA